MSLTPSPPTLASESALLVACLCAEWCGVCREYRAAFDQVGARFPSVRFLWVDVEDQADQVDPMEVDDFPTLLIAQGDTPLFYGTMLPRADRLERQLRESFVRTVGNAAAAKPETQALLQRLRAAA